jgi:glutathione synthase/RimK-type ligase-like ATP-grasp enzyme
MTAFTGADGTWASTLHHGQRSIRLEEVRSIWYRRPTPFIFPDEFGAADCDFAFGESRKAIGGLLRGLECIWVNHPDKMTGADYKPHQLSLAAKLGLDIPRTLLTNSPEAVLEFRERCTEDIVYKTLSYPMVGVGDDRERMLPLFTSRVTDEHMTKLDLVRATPCLFQEYVPKELELRLTVVGDTVFSAAVYSQENEISATDWRRGLASADVALRYERHDLPIDVRNRCLGLVDALGLEYAALDLILTPDGRYVFLEVNPAGEWGWIQAETGMDLALAIAEHLAKGKPAR